MPRFPPDENAALLARIEAYGPKRPGFVRQALLDVQPELEKEILKSVSRAVLACAKKGVD